MKTPVLAVLFAALFIGGVVLRSSGDVVFGVVLMVVSVLPLLHALLAGVLGRRG